MIDNQYPIGHYKPEEFSLSLKDKYVKQIAELPFNLNLAIEKLSLAQLQTPYRDGGWTIHELVHHIFDSHCQAIFRFKLALTSTHVPTISPYDEKEYVNTADVVNIPIANLLPSLNFMHDKWVYLLKSVSESNWQNKSVYHPEKKITMSLFFLAGLYAWHGQHHVAQINGLRNKKGW